MSERVVGIRCLVESIAVYVQRHLNDVVEVYDSLGLDPKEIADRIAGRRKGTPPPKVEEDIRLHPEAELMLFSKRLYDIWRGRRMFVPVLVTETRPGVAYYIYTYPTYRVSLEGMRDFFDAVTGLIETDAVDERYKHEFFFREIVPYMDSRHASPEASWIRGEIEWRRGKLTDLTQYARSRYTGQLTPEGEGIVDPFFVSEHERRPGVIEKVITGADAPLFEEIPCQLFEPEIIDRISDDIQAGLVTLEEYPEIMPEAPPEERVLEVPAPEEIVMDAVMTNPTWWRWAEESVAL